MQIAFVRPWSSISGPVAAGEISEFVVLSGPNGSGKSNLLEALYNGSLLIDGVTTEQPVGQPQPGVRLFSLAQLVIAAEGAQPMTAFRDRWINLKQHVENLKLQHVQQGGFTAGSSELEEQLRRDLVGTRMITEAALKRMLTTAQKRLVDFSDFDYRTASPLLTGTGLRDAFALTVTELFLTYQQRRVRNDFLQWLQTDKKRSDVESLTDEAFVDRYGPPPWQLFDEILTLLGLQYGFVAPSGVEDDLPYEARLSHQESGSEVTLGQLSSGEKTLMAIGMTLYGGSYLEHEIEMPKVLLLDEADASLYPSMVQSLLRVVDEIFNQRYGVKVVMTTHSPSTVALAPERSIYTMRRVGNPRLRHTSRDAAIKDLAVGLPGLSVRNELRRQVFVESEVDEACYQAMFRILRQSLVTELSLEFIAAGRGGNGGDEAVKHLVANLRAAGNLAIRGVVDRDARSGAPDGIYFIADRYALENVVLDPLIVGIFLVRERLARPEEMSLPQGLRHFEIREAHIQTVVDFVVNAMPRVADQNRVEVRYTGGGTALVPRAFLDSNGHEVEDWFGDAFPPLKAHRGRLKLVIIEAVMQDLPRFVPVEVVDLFKRMLDAPA